MPTEISVLGSDQVPLKYDVDVEGTITPLACSAVFDGTGASGPFTPAIALYAPGGNLISRVPTDQVLQVGDSAEVTFAPFLGRASGAGRLTFHYAYLSYAQLVHNITSTDVVWAALNTDSSATFQLDGTGTKVQIGKPGWVIVSYVGFGGGNTMVSNLEMLFVNPFGFTVPILQDGNDSTHHHLLQGTFSMPQFATDFGTPSEVVLNLNQSSGVDQTTSGICSIGLWGPIT